MRRKAVSKTTQLKHEKARTERLMKEIETLKADVKLYQEFFIKEYKLHLSCKVGETLNHEAAIKRYSVQLNKVQPFFTGL